MTRLSLRFPRPTLIVTMSLLAAIGTGCGGAKPAESADSTPGDSSAAPADEKPSAEPAAASADAEKKPAEEAHASDDAGGTGPTPPRTPKDIVTAPDVLFMFSFNDSDMKKVAEERCEKSSGGDAKKNADCMAKARTKVDHDGMGFKQSKSGGWVWTTIKRNGNVLVTLHSVPIELGEETKNSIKFKTTGKDTGTKPKAPPAEVTLGVPNDYQISIKDPQQGLMVYEAKIGIVGDEGGAKR